MKKLLEKLSHKSNLLITIVGVILLICLIMVALFPHSGLVILLACIACASMNLLQGIKYLQDVKKQAVGWSVIMLGIIIIVAGFIVYNR
jgi:uncharacterized membrane protein HdeD (DUF308 family)